MTIVRRPSPLGELVSLRQAMDRLFEDSFVRSRPWGMNGEAGTPLPLDITSSADALLVDAALPGIPPEDVEITVEDGTLTIRGSTRQERRESEGDVLVQEIRRGEVSRSLSLPNGLEPDRAEATFEDGILTLRIPRAEQVKPRQIRISPTSNGTHATDSATTTDSRPGGTDAAGESGQA
jgi:HSP20 family protein